MKTKIVINTPKATEAAKEYMAEKAAFRKAAREGKALEFVKKKAQQLAKRV